MTREEYAKSLIADKYNNYNIMIPYDEVINSLWSGELIDVKLNDGSVELVDRLVEFTLCSLYSYYFIDRYCYTLDPVKGPVPFKLHDFQKEALQSFQENSKVIFRKCLTENNYILTQDGQYKSIKNIKQGELVETIKDGIQTWTKVIDAWKNDELKDIIEIHLWNGSIIESTLDHKIMTSEGWKEAQDLTIKDKIILSDNKFGDFELEYDEMAKIIGYYVADGKAAEPTFTNTNKKYIDEIYEASKVFTDINPYIKHKKQENYLDRYDVRFTSHHRSNKRTSFQDFGSKYNLDKKSNDRYFSPEIMNLNKRQLSILLNRMFAGDGWAGFGFGRKKQGDFYIGYGTPNKTHAFQLQRLLGKFGIWSKIIPNNYKNYNTFYKIIIPNKIHILKFIQEIGIYDKTDSNYISLLENHIKYKQKGEYNTIRKIVYKSNPKITYDITTESCDFIANGVLVHNSRQVGASVISGAYALWRANFQKAQKITIISLTMNDALAFKEKTIDLNYHDMPGFLKSKATRDGYSKTKLKLANLSQVMVKSKSKDAGRGDTPSLVIVDEAAFNEWMDDIWLALEPSLDKGGDCIIISTTNGVGNWYHSTYTKASEGLNEFRPVFIPWWRYPGRSNPWLEDILAKRKSGEMTIEQIEEFVEAEKRKQLSYEGPAKDGPWLWKRRANAKTERNFSQEILADFLGSGETIVTLKTIQRLEEGKRTPQWIDTLPSEIITDPVHGLWCWRDRYSGGQYMLTADTATGHGKDFSAFEVIDVYKNEQVAEFKGQVPTDTCGEIIKKVARYYNNAYVMIETNHPGPAVFNEVFRSKIDPYDNVYVKRKGNGYVSWETTPKSRVLLVDSYFKDLENATTRIYSERLIEEVKTFVWYDDGKPEAMKGNNDDLVIAYAIFCHNKDFVFSSRPMNISTSRTSANDLNAEAVDLKWQEREDEIQDTYGMSLLEYYWVQGIPIPPEYKKIKTIEQELEESL